MADSCTIDELDARLEKLANSLTSADVAPYMPVVKTMALTDQRRHFQKSMTPEGVPWTPLRYPRPNGGNKVLRNFGALMASVTAKTTNDTVIVGTNLVYAGVHQFGGVIRPKPGKKFLTIPLTVEAMRWGSPRRAGVRLHPAIRKGATKGALYEMSGGNRIFHYALVQSVTLPARTFLGYSDLFIEDVSMLYVEINDRKLAAFTGGK